MEKGKKKLEKHKREKRNMDKGEKKDVAFGLLNLPFVIDFNHRCPALLLASSLGSLNA